MTDGSYNFAVKSVENSYRSCTPSSGGRLAGSPTGAAARASVMHRRIWAI